MIMIDFNKLNEYRENNRIEVKSAQGGLPQSIWETYSAFANTNGGVILLGVEEKSDKSLKALGLSNPEKLIADFWSIINNPQKVNMNILFDRHVYIKEIDGECVIIIEVPRADKTEKPIFLNEKPFAETYRRNGDGDFHCSESLVLAMFRDKSDVTQDMLVLEKMTVDVFDYTSLRGYRNRMKATRPDHVWENLDDIEFLRKLGAVGIGDDKKLHPTAAGLLMFGNEYEILREYPQYFIDYQEKYDADVRYTDRIISGSGEWSGNINDFYFKAYNKLIQNPKIKIPFKMKDGMQRTDDTPIHKALREALANCLTNADFYGPRGLVIRNNLNEIIMENPGGFRIEISEAKSGGISSPRNSVILRMFNMLDIGERTGSGIPSIYQNWQEQGAGAPEYKELFNPDRTILTLPLDSENKVINFANDNESGDKQKVAISDIKKQMIINYLNENDICKASEISALLQVNASRTKVYLQELVADGIVVAEGANRNRTYRLTAE